MPLEDEVLNWLKGLGYPGKIIICLAVIYIIISSIPGFLTGANMTFDEAYSIKDWLTHKELSDSDLKKQTIELANSISDFIGIRKMQMDRLSISQQYNMSLLDLRNPNDTRVQKEWYAGIEQDVIFYSETHKIFNEKYLGDVIRIRQEFWKRNMSNKELDRDINVTVTNGVLIDDIPVRLHELASKLP
jgi:hypothetical protein